jgi:hypothetical protein
MRALVVPLLALVLAACSTSSSQASHPAYEIAGLAVAGPTCPVEPANPAPGECDPRPVGGATLVVTDDAGRPVLTLTTGEDGRFTASLPAGDYILTPQPMDGLMGGASPVPFTVEATDPPMDLVIAYDTGIR